MACSLIVKRVLAIVYGRHKRQREREREKTAVVLFSATQEGTYRQVRT
jgi:hypothetical protein